MKIGIITIHNSPNYGACLQSFALWKYLTNLGNDVEIINLYRPHQPEYVLSKRYTQCRLARKNLVHRIISRLKKRIIPSKPQKYLGDVAQARFDAFNHQIKLSRPYYSIEDLYDNPPLYDVYISGSDQLWNPTQAYCLEPYFLTFVPQGKVRMSYASSIGITELTMNEKRRFGEWLSKYDAISVRERQAKELIETLITNKVDQVADPTFLLDRAYWKSIAVTPERKESFILLFTLSYDKPLLDYTRSLSKQSGLKVVYLTAIQPEEHEDDYESVTDAGPKEWLGLIGNAEMVITNSFHGTVFSLIMGTKNFFTYIAPTNKRGIRITELLETYNMSDHLLTVDLSETYNQIAGIVINHQKVDEVMENEKSKSRRFLSSNLTTVI